MSTSRGTTVTARSPRAKGDHVARTCPAASERTVIVLWRKQVVLATQLEGLPDHPQLGKSVVDPAPHLLRRHAFELG